MSKCLIYLIAIFCLWMYFKITNFWDNRTEKQPTIEDFDKAQSGNGGTMTASKGTYTPGGGFNEDEKIAGSYSNKT